MSASSNQPKPKKNTNSGDNNNKCTQRWRNFKCWASISVRDNFPHYLIAAFTLALAIFAWWAWLESQRGTAALEGQLSQMQRQAALTISQLRPKLSLSFNGPKEPMKVEGKEGWFITPTWINRGGSEGIYFWGWDGGKLFTPNVPTNFDFLTFDGDASTASKVTIGINDPHLQVSRFLSREDVQNIIDKKGVFVIWGYIEYRESLPGNVLHHVHWCYEVFPSDAGNNYIFSYSAYRAECNSSE